jgi:hypothetical protein
LTNRQKTTLRQGALASVRGDLLNRADFGRSKEKSKELSEMQIRGAEQRSRSKEPIRDATSGGDQRSQIRGPTKIKNQHGNEERTL